MPRIRSNSLVTHEHTLSGEKLALLAVFAHPEDEAFGPAGTLARYANEGIDVSLVTATRNSTTVESEEEHHHHSRDRVCACRSSGIRRACLFDYRPGELSQVDPQIIEERLVRLIREIRPQVIVTFGPSGLNSNRDNQIINQAALRAFQSAGDASKFAHHLADGLTVYAPQKLYYCVLPQSLVQRWGITDVNTMPDDQITTVLDVSAYSESMKNALFCQRQGARDFILWLTEHPQVEWRSEYYTLVESRLRKKPRREKDLFAGLR